MKSNIFHVAGLNQTDSSPAVLHSLAIALTRSVKSFGVPNRISLPVTISTIVIIRYRFSKEIIWSIDWAMSFTA